jgi:type II secretory pathway component PulF
MLLYAFAIGPEMERIYNDFGMGLPGVARFFFALGTWLREQNGTRAVVAVLTAPYLLWASDRLFLKELQRRRVARGMPLVGPLWGWLSTAAFARLLGALVVAEVPLTEALPLAGEGTGDPALAGTGRRLAHEVGRGRSLAEAARQEAVLPHGCAKLLGWAEENRTLPETLELLGGLFEARARAQAEFVTGVFGTLTVALVLWDIAFVGASLVLPLIAMLRSLTVGGWPLWTYTFDWQTVKDWFWSWLGY